MSRAAFRRLSVAAQAAVVTPAERPRRGLGKHGRIIPTLERLCPGKYPKGTAYGEVLDPVRVPPSEGRFVRLGRGPDAVRATVHVMSSPPRPTLSQLSRPGVCSVCEPGYVVSVEGPDGEPRYLAVSAKQTREVNRRERGPLCPHGWRLTTASLARVAEVVERVEAGGGHPRDYKAGRDFPFPHRAGSSPCCDSSEATPERVLAALARWSRGERAGFTAAALVELARRAVPIGSDIRPPDRISEVRAAMEAVRDHCWEGLAARVATAQERRADKFHRLMADVRTRYTPQRAPRGGGKGSK